MDNICDIRYSYEFVAILKLKTIHKCITLFVLVSALIQRYDTRCGVVWLGTQPKFSGFPYLSPPYRELVVCHPWKTHTSKINDFPIHLIRLHKWCNENIVYWEDTIIFDTIYYYESSGKYTESLCVVCHSLSKIFKIILVTITIHSLSKI